MIYLKIKQRFKISKKHINYFIIDFYRNLKYNFCIKFVEI